MMLQAVQPELADDFFRLRGDLLVAHTAFEKILTVLFCERGFDGGNAFRVEDFRGKLITSLGEQFVDGRRHGAKFA